MKRKTCDTLKFVMMVAIVVLLAIIAVQSSDGFQYNQDVAGDGDVSSIIRIGDFGHEFYCSGDMAEGFQYNSIANRTTLWSGAKLNGSGGHYRVYGDFGVLVDVDVSDARLIDGSVAMFSQINPVEDTVNETVGYSITGKSIVNLSATGKVDEDVTGMDGSGHPLYLGRTTAEGVVELSSEVVF